VQGGPCLGLVIPLKKRGEERAWEAQIGLESLLSSSLRLT